MLGLQCEACCARRAERGVLCEACCVVSIVKAISDAKYSLPRDRAACAVQEMCSVLHVVKRGTAHCSSVKRAFSEHSDLKVECNTRPQRQHDRATAATKNESKAAQESS